MTADLHKGLYHKLHGHHRPVQMKKSEIKRRKRVVPANTNYDNQQPAYAEQSSDAASSHAPSTSPNPRHQHITPLEPRTGPTAIPVDYTDTFRRPLSTVTEPSLPHKRPYAAASAKPSESEPYPHPQNMGFSAINAIDPSLPTREPQSREARRAELQREAERMRQMLEEKERELAALNDDA